MAELPTALARSYLAHDTIRLYPNVSMHTHVHSHAATFILSHSLQSQPHIDTQLIRTGLHPPTHALTHARTHALKYFICTEHVQTSFFS